jgi:zinc protease
VSAYHNSQLQSGDFYVRVTARADMDLGRLEQAVLEEIAKLAASPPAEAEMERVKNGLEMSFISSLETALGKAEQMNRYYYYTGDPDHVAEDLARYRALTPADIQRVAREYLEGKHRIVISIVPQGRTELAARPREVS